MNIQRITRNSEGYEYHRLPNRTIKFNVKASNDAHIMLSEFMEPKDSDNVVEIFIGGWENQYSAFRLNRRPEDDSEHFSTPDILKHDAFQAFSITLDSGSNGTIISVSRGTSTFMMYEVPKSFSFNFFGVRTGEGAIGEWRINSKETSTDGQLRYENYSPIPSLLKNVIPERWIGRTGPNDDALLNCPPRSPDITPCKEISTDGQLRYENYFPIPSFSLDVQVKAAHDAHIALTSGPYNTNPMYEVFIGGWENLKNGIRFNHTDPGDEPRKDSPYDVLSGTEFRRFHVSWKNGMVDLKNVDGESLVRGQARDLVSVTHFGIRTFHAENKVKGEWTIVVEED